MEIGKYLLKQRGYFKESLKIKTWEIMQPKERLNLLFGIINKIDKETNITQFKSNIHTIFNSELLMLDLLKVLKTLSEEEDNKQIRETELNDVFNDTLSMNTKEINFTNLISIDNQSKSTPFRDQSISNEVDNNKISHHHHHHSLIIETEVDFPRFNNKEKRVDDLKGKMTLRKHKFNNVNNLKNSRKIIPSKEIKGLKYCPISCRPKNKTNNTIEVTKSSSFSLSPANLPSQTIDYCSIDSRSKLSQQISFEDVVNGIKKLCASSNYVTCNKQTIPYYQFIKPSDIIVDSSVSYLIKRTMFDHKVVDTYVNAYGKSNKTKRTNSDLIPLSSHKDILTKEINDYFKNYDSNPIDSIRRKIYSWFIEMNMFKCNQVDINDIPLLCKNGIFICDLINKCEGRFEAIHGINRNIKNSTQIKVNLRKALEYLKKKESFPCRHLWAIDDIKSGNEAIIWGLLEDIWRLYTNKVIRSFSSNTIIRPIALSRESNNSTNRLINNNKSSKNVNMKMNNDQHLNIFDQRNNLQFYNSLIRQTCLTSKTKRVNNPSIQIFNHFSINDIGFNSNADNNKNSENIKNTAMTTINTTKLPKKYLLL